MGVRRSVVQALEAGEEYVVATRGREVRVKVMDANHCPGAVMFAFQAGGAGEWTLFTGDFRYQKSWFEGCGVAGLAGKVGRVLLDDTYAGNDTRLPSRESAAESVVNMVRRFKKKFQSGLVLLGVDRIGKEELMMKIARECGGKLFIEDPQRVEIVRIVCQMMLGDEWKRKMDQMFTIDREAEDCFVWIVARSGLGIQMIEELRHTVKRPVIGIRPSGWNCQVWESSQPTDRKRVESLVNQGMLPEEGPDDGELILIPYSLHSSQDELAEFLLLLQPRQVIPLTSSTLNGVLKDWAMPPNLQAPSTFIPRKFVDSSRKNRRRRAPRKLSLVSDLGAEVNETPVRRFP